MALRSSFVHQTLGSIRLLAADEENNAIAKKPKHAEVIEISSDDEDGDAGIAVFVAIRFESSMRLEFCRDAGELAWCRGDEREERPGSRL
jgi:hypothetical protein